MKKNSLKVFMITSTLCLSGCSLHKDNLNIPKLTMPPVIRELPETTVTSEPTVTPEPTATPVPTATPIPTATPEPTATPVPTSTPVPTATPIPKDKVLVLTFDDGPTKYTPQLLEYLKEMNIKVTFFVLDYKVKVNPEYVKQAYLDGHEICIHSYSHASFTEIGPDKTKEEIIKTRQRLLDLGIIPINAVRPPYGHLDNEIKEAIKSIGNIDGTDTETFSIIMWGSDSRDWENRDPDIMTNIVLKEVNKIGNGCIILFHDTTQTTIDGIKKTIPALLEQGYTFATLTEASENYNVELEDGKVYYNVKKK